MKARWILAAVVAAAMSLLGFFGQRHNFGNAGARLHAELIVHDERFFSRVVWGGDQGTGDSYMDGDWSSPDLVSLVRVAVRNGRRLDGSGGPLAWINGIVHRFRHWRKRAWPA